MDKISQYCQKCSKANSVGERTCRRCGTRLMLVVFPPSVRHDDGIVPSFYEDHLLERISILEIQLAQAIEKIGVISAFFAREAKEIKKEQTFIRSFAESIKAANPAFADESIRRRGEKDFSETETSEDVDVNSIQNRIIARYAKPNGELFTHILKEGFRLLAAGEEKHAFQMLDRAALLAPENLLLLVVIAEKLYRADKFEESKIYLERALDLEPNNEKVLLLLGVICADAGEIDNGRKFLSVPANGENFFALVHFVWGIMAAYEENWNESIAAFKLASRDAQSPEINYLIGCAYFQSGNYISALRFFEKIDEAGEKYSDSRFMKSVVYRIENDAEAEKNELRIVSEIKEPGAQCLDYITGKKLFDAAAVALPFAHFKQSKKQLLTGGAPRLSKFFRERILKAVE